MKVTEAEKIKISFGTELLDLEKSKLCNGFIRRRRVGFGAQAPPRH